MTSTLAMFPLEIVVFPDEQVALHIFEERYIQLIEDCENDFVTFGIPTYYNKTMSYGTEVKLVEVVKRYPSGACDIICEGMRVFKIDSFYQKYGEKLYSGASIDYLPNLDNASLEQRKRFLKLVRKLHTALGIVYEKIAPEEITSYTLAHKIGLGLNQELKLIQIESEAERFAFLIDHLSVTIKVVQDINKTKAQIQMNGHFKNFDPLDFKDFKIT